MPNPAHAETRQLYASLIEEVKIRIAAIDAGTGGTLAPMLRPQIVREHCFLQIRLICELIALGCLVAHGDLERGTKLKNQWDANKIMGELERLHPDFFPVPIDIAASGRGYFDVAPASPSLDKKGLLSLYEECGRHLHKGTLKNLLKQNSPVVIHFPDITAKAQKICDLLARHMLIMTGANDVLIPAALNIDTRPVAVPD